VKYVPAWMPGARVKRVGAKYRKTNIDQTDRPYNFVLKEMVYHIHLFLVLNLIINRRRAKTALPSFTANALQSGKPTTDEEYALKFIAAALYAGGLDTVLQLYH
jgi:hypothetical protein